MGVDVHRGGDAAVAEEFLDEPEVGASGEEETPGAMAQLVECPVKGEARRLQEGFEVPDWSSLVGAKHKVELLPLTAGRQALSALLPLVGLECFLHLRRYWDRPFTPRLGEIDVPPADRVNEPPADRELRVAEIDVRPAEAEVLRGTEAREECELEQGLKARALRGGEEAASLLERECPLLAGVLPWQRDVASRVEGDEVPADRLSKGGVEDSVGQAYRAGGQPSFLAQPPVEFLDLQGAEPVQEDATEVRPDVPFQLPLVLLEGIPTE